MNHKDPNNDSGKYVDGVYTTKNGFSGTGLNCPKGTRLYDTGGLKEAIFFIPEGVAEPGEKFAPLTSEVAEGVMDYYAISSYGKLINRKSQKVMKPNYRPNGYEYFCLAAEGTKTGQRKYTTHRMVMKTFKPREDQDDLQVNHVNGNKADNYVDKIMPDGSVESNLEWATPSENVVHALTTGLNRGSVLSMEDAKEIRDLHDQGYSYGQIRTNNYPYVSLATIHNVCKNFVYTDPNYTPRSYADAYKENPANRHMITDRDAELIRKLAADGYNYTEIKNKFYSDFSVSTISDIVRGISHNRGNTNSNNQT